MKRILLLIALAALVGCGKKEPVLPFVSNPEEIKLWEFKTGGAIGDSSPAIGSDGTVFFGSEDKKLYAINGKSELKLWEFETGGRELYSPSIGTDGTV